MGLFSKEEAPKGPDFNKLIELSNGFVKENSALFEEAMKFGKGQFSKAEEWSTKLENFGMDAMGKLGDEADNFKATVGERVAGLDKAGAEWGKKAAGIYGENKALADKVTGELLPAMGQSAELGGTLLDSYTEKGIPFQDEYIGKLAGWDTTQRREDRAASAVNDFKMASAAERENELRRLESFGIDPSQTRSAALDARLGVAAAIHEAGLMNQERRAVEGEGITLGGVASDMYNDRAALGFGAIDQAGETGRTLAEIARQPGADYMQALTGINTFGLGVGQLEQAGGRAGYDMKSDAARFGERGKVAGANQQNTANNYGSALYDQGGTGIRQGADITQGAYQTGGALNANDIARVAENNKNSFGGQIGELAGIAAPFVMNAVLPGSGTIASAATAASGAAGGGGAPATGTNWLDRFFSEGGPVDPELSPTLGAIPDDVAARVSAREFILDEPTARWFGEKHLRNMQAQAKKGLGIPERTGA